MKEKQPEIKIDPKKLKPKVIELHKKICAMIDPMIEEAEGLDVQSQIELTFVLFAVFCNMTGISGKNLYEFSKFKEIGHTNLDEKVLENYKQLGKEIFGQDFHEKSPSHPQS